MNTGDPILRKDTMADKWEWTLTIVLSRATVGLFLLSVLFHDFPAMSLLIECYKWIRSFAKPSWQPLRASSRSLFSGSRSQSQPWAKVIWSWRSVFVRSLPCSEEPLSAGLPTEHASPLYHFSASCSNLRTQGSQNLCWEPRLNAQLLILLTVANGVPSEAQRPETTSEEKVVTNTRLASLFLFGIWHQRFDFLPVPWDC